MSFVIPINYWLCYKLLPYNSWLLISEIDLVDSRPFLSCLLSRSVMFSRLWLMTPMDLQTATFAIQLQMVTKEVHLQLTPPEER